MNFLFGTDGIRGIVNKYPMDCETLIRIGKAIAKYFASENRYKTIIIGWDTRISSHMITSAVASGISSIGINVILAGVIPTPGIAQLTKKGNFCAGIVISASHNPFYDNGIKIFDENGRKLNNFTENKLENMIIEPKAQNKNLKIELLGQIFLDSKIIKRYNSFLEKSYSDFPYLQGTKIVLDCSNGATSFCAPILFKKLGAEVITLSCSPNGININDNCGSEYPKFLAKSVVEESADLGLAFDGDGDRVILISELGEILNGDQIIAIFANIFKKIGLLKNNTVVTTIMSNTGLDIALKKMGINHIKSKVGDKYVAKKMMESGAILGGENSGHIILGNYQTTGDGILVGLHLLGLMKKYNFSLSNLSKIIRLFPQCLININAVSQPDLSKIDFIQNKISLIRNYLGKNSRIIIRYSGTQPKCRIMVEGNNFKKVQIQCKYLANIISKYINL